MLKPRPIRDEVGKRLGKATLEMLTSEPVPWLLAPYGGGGVRWRPVLPKSSICWRRYTIDLDLEPTDAKLPAEMEAVRDTFEEIVASTAGTLDFLVREGELLFVDNHRTIHARTPNRQTGKDSNRLVIRSWIEATNPTSKE